MNNTQNFYNEMNLINEQYDQMKSEGCESKLKSFWIQIIISISFAAAFILFLFIMLIVAISSSSWGAILFLQSIVMICLLGYTINGLVLSIRMLANDYGYSKIDGMKKLWGLLALLWFPALLFQIIFVVKARRMVRFYKSYEVIQV